MDKRVKEIVDQMTLEEKAAFVSGRDFWTTKPIERLGLKSHMLTDGPHGLRKQEGEADHLGINQSVPATCFPTASATCCSFDPELLERMGEAMGAKCIRENVSVILGPGVNIKRSPLCGRNFEYFSEDPYLAGVMGAGLVRGVQKCGVGTSLKHFACNDQETARMICDSVVDDRALHEIYLSAFEKIVRETQPWTVMCCYNKVNGLHGSDDHLLNEELLRDEWGFEGAVVSDWGATVDGVNAIRAGMDLEMPGCGDCNKQRIIDAVKKGELSVEDLDRSVSRIVGLYLKCQDDDLKKLAPNRTEEDDHSLAREVAAQSMVLLKNQDVLPLKKEDKVAFIGLMAKKPRYQGAGSSKINPSFLDTAYDCALEEGYEVVYSDGYEQGDNEGLKQTGLLEQAVSVAASVDKVVVFAGLPDEYESEGFDREVMDMPKSHIALIEAVAKVNRQVTVVLQLGSPVALPWKNSVGAILLSYLGGQGGGHATVDLLWGKENPSGKLGETWPRELADNPSAAYFPGSPRAVEYRESIYVGYRYYDKAGVDVNYPFGYGLSYTSFSYRDMKVKELAPMQYEISVRVENTGKYAGREVVELYVEPVDSRIFRPLRELKAFTKVFLDPGEEKTVKLLLDADTFRYYNTAAHAFCHEGGEYRLEIGRSSRDIDLTEIIYIEGDHQEKLLLDSYAELTGYAHPTVPFRIDDIQFRQLLGHELPSGEPVKRGRFTSECSLGEIKDTLIGRKMLKMIAAQGEQLLEDNADEGMKRMAQAMMMDMPLRALTMTGAMTLDQADGIADMANGHYIRGLRKMKKK